MSFEKAKKYLNKSITKNEFEEKVKDLENSSIPIKIPRMATGAVIPPAAIISAQNAETEERRHQEILKAISENNKPENTKPTKKIKHGPTDKTKEKFELFNFIKNEVPYLSYEGVAMRATKGNQHYTGDDVRNTYRAMKVKFPRGDRIR